MRTNISSIQLRNRLFNTSFFTYQDIKFLKLRFDEFGEPRNTRWIFNIELMKNNIREPGIFELSGSFQSPTLVSSS
ncbi:hypothetical protein Hanom_Chr06g00480531 [Helianthus anomalus]